MFQIAYNERKYIYEVHARGCKHLISKHLDLMPGEYEGPGSKAKETFEKGNEDCHATLGPCAR